MTDALATLDDLPPKRQDFVIAYVGEAQRNATKAAEMAGYSCPASQGSRLLKDVKVTAVVESLLKEMLGERIASAEEVQAFLTAVMRGEVGEPVTSLAGEWTGEYSPAKIKDRRAAAMDLAKLRGYDAPTRHEVELRPAPMPLEDARKVVLLHREEERDAG